MQYQVSKRGSRGEIPQSQSNTNYQRGLVDKSLVARLEKEKAPLDRISIQVLGLSTRVHRGLKSAYIDSIHQLINRNESELLKIRNFGTTSLDEIKHKLNSYFQVMLASGDWFSQAIDISQFSGENNGSLLESMAECQIGIVDESLLVKLEEEKPPLDKISVKVLGLSSRGYNALKNSNINTIEQLIDCSENDLSSIRNIGITTLYDVKNKLNSYIDTTLKTGDWDSQIIQTSDNAESSSLHPLETIRTPLTLAQAFNDLFETLKNPRQSMILNLRYGLDGGMPRTLEEVGKHFNITRERVRQIQEKALRKLRHPSRKRIFNDIVQPFELVLRQAGGLLKEEQLCERIPEVVVISGINPPGALCFIQDVTSQFEEIGNKIWALKECPLECFPIVTSTAALRLEDNHSRLRYNQLVSDVRRVLESSNNVTQQEVDTLFIEACLQADPQFEISKDGWCILAKWQQSFIDEIVEVLREKNTALHFREIASNVKKLLNNNQDVSEHNVHAVLQRRQDLFVWMGPGTYGLVEWGIQRPGYYLDLITGILEDEEKALPAEEIIRRVEEIRPCKKTSIMMYLTLNDRFTEFSPGVYGLRKWLSTKPDHGAELPDSFTDELKRRLAVSLCGNEKEPKGGIKPIVADQDEKSGKFPVTADPEAVQGMETSSESARTQGILRILREMPPGRHNMVEIIEWLMTNERYDELKRIILGNTPSTAPYTLHNGTDICISRVDDNKCPRFLRNKSCHERGEILLQYRLDWSSNLLTKIKETSGDELRNLLNQLLLDPIHMKFGTAYTLVVEGKTQLLHEKIITADCRVLRKDHGQYCPYDDVWELTI